MIKILMRSSLLLYGASLVTMLSSLMIVYFSGSILSPLEYGYFSAAMIVVTLLESTKQLGVKESIIAEKNLTEEHLDTGWTIDLIKSCILCCIAYFGAYFYASYVEFEYAYLMICILITTLLFEGLINKNHILFRKNLNFKKLMYFDISCVLFYSLITVLLLILLKSAWALVIGFLLKSIFTTVLSYLVLPTKFNFKIVYAIAIKQLNYGKWLLLSGLLFFLTNRLDNVVVMAYLDMEALGYYAFAFSIANGVVASPLKSITNALFPLLSKDKYIDRATAYKTLLLLALIVLCYTGTMSFILPFLLDQLFEEKWSESYNTLAVLIIALGINAIKLDSYFMAMSLTKVKFKIELLRAIVTSISLIPLTILLGIQGAAYSILIGIVVALIFWVISMKKVLGSH